MKTITISSIVLSLILSCSAHAHDCGKVKGNKIITHGELSCSEARHVYMVFQQGHTPANWTCGLSAGECFYGKVYGKRGFTFSRE